MSIKVAVLGESGVTGKAVIETLNRIPGYLHVSDVQTADWIVASPGISPNDFPKVNAPIVSEIEFAYELFRRSDSEYCPKLIGITGTNGKTTVTEMISAVTGAPACGNIGTPLITFVDHPDKPEWLAVELSSYQLETCQKFRPEIAVLMNITPDHLQRHGTMHEYAQQKAKIFTAQCPHDCLIYLENDPEIQTIIHRCPSRKIPFSERSPEYDLVLNTLDLPGVHNMFNALATVYAVREFGIPIDRSLEILRQFRLAEHRLERVAEIDGVWYINDSKSTNPDATMVAARAFPNSHVLICGKDKDLDLGPLVAFLSEHSQSVIAFGEIASRYLATAKSMGLADSIRLADTLASAVELAKSKAKPGDTVLLSPACSSFDQFQNYEDRGNQFKSVVNQLAHSRA